MLTCIVAVDGQVDDGAHAVAGNGFNAQMGHQLVVAGSHRYAVHPGR